MRAFEYHRRMLEALQRGLGERFDASRYRTLCGLAGYDGYSWRRCYRLAQLKGLQIRRVSRGNSWWQDLTDDWRHFAGMSPDPCRVYVDERHLRDFRKAGWRGDFPSWLVPSRKIPKIP